MSELFALVLILLIAAGLGLAIVFLGRGGPRPTAPQRIPVLGGAEPQTHAWQRYHVRYYPMTLLFIAFEMEMMFMYPWAVVFMELGLKALVEMGMFLAILSLGIFYGWREGVFRWQ